MKPPDDVPYITVSAGPDAVEHITVVEHDIVAADEPERDDKPAQHHASDSSFAAATIHMQKVILGAGMMVIPRAFLLIGNLLAVIFLALVATMTWFTISGLLLAAEQTGMSTYGAVVKRCCGHRARWTLLFAVAANCFGLCVMFVIIFADILVGSGDHPGLLNELLPQVPDDAWFLQRWFVLLVLMAAVLGPLVLEGDLSRLQWINLVGVSAIVGFAVSTACLAGAALWQGIGHVPVLLPDFRGSPLPPAQVAIQVIGVLSIVLSSDVCHQGVFPATMLLRPYTRGGMNRVMAYAIASCNALYVLIAICSFIAFGDALDDDVLNNMSAAAMGPLVGPNAAALIAYGVRAGFLVSLLGSFVLNLYPLRGVVLEVACGSSFHAEPQEAHWAFYPVTVLLMMLIYVTGVCVPSIWIVTSLVGSIAATLMGFIIPGFVILATCREKTWGNAFYKAAAVVVILVGVFLLVNGIVVALVVW